MNVADLLAEIYGRVPPLAKEAVAGLTPDQLVERPSTKANPVGWLVWHLTRVEDGHISEILETEQVWTSGEWAGRFGLDADPDESGWGHSISDVARVRPESADALLEYFNAVHRRTTAMLEQVGSTDLDRIVDRNWDPPVTLGVRLVSIVDDALQHAGQAAYVRGLLGV